MMLTHFTVVFNPMHSLKLDDTVGNNSDPHQESMGECPLLRFDTNGGVNTTYTRCSSVTHSFVCETHAAFHNERTNNINNYTATHYNTTQELPTTTTTTTTTRQDITTQELSTYTQHTIAQEPATATVTQKHTTLDLMSNPTAVACYQTTSIQQEKADATTTLPDENKSVTKIESKRPPDHISVTTPQKLSTSSFPPPATSSNRPPLYSMLLSSSTARLNTIITATKVEVTTQTSHNIVNIAVNVNTFPMAAVGGIVGTLAVLVVVVVIFFMVKKTRNINRENGPNIQAASNTGDVPQNHSENNSEAGAMFRNPTFTAGEGFVSSDGYDTFEMLSGDGYEVLEMRTGDDMSPTSYLTCGKYVYQQQSPV
ncbi:uncharacterized protein LOC117343537 [Pecten maximus]|uniref:uncharacterized protein LOC117343537 n=1 Tax=Pecten maximus TaxID=6579 RepID=UPI0014584C72|nr:uncharacterized protein LOC117343537 [Pecten maximus]